MKHNWKSFLEQFEKMPLFGKLREHDKRLTFGQYLTVLKEWWEKTKAEGEDFKKELREIKKAVDAYESDRNFMEGRIQTNMEIFLE